MARLSKEQIAQSAKVVEFECGQLGGTVAIAPLSAAAYLSMQDDFKRAESDPAFKAQFMARLVAASLVDEHGQRMFGEAEIDALQNLKGIAVLELFNKVMEVNGLAEADEGN